LFNLRPKITGLDQHATGEEEVTLRGLFDRQFG
jgi:hypothetical protein